ncbi:MAG: hypothetical protein IKG97_01730 [Lachnospiraceae bacterium]|nr:hypothetical protein [Lachnospiraceae bacterium]
MLNKLERKLGKVRWPSFMLILLGAYATGMLLQYIYPEALVWICFSPAHILRGQVWRLFSFVATPTDSSIFMTLLLCFIYFSISRSLERIVGRFKVNFFLLTGWLITILSGFLYYWIFPGSSVLTVRLNMHYVFSTLFIVFSFIYPDATFLLMFFIPVKGKWMPFITLGMFAIELLQIFLAKQFAYGWLYLFMIVAAVLNVVLFLLLLGFKIKKQPRNSTQRHYQRETRENGGAYRGNGGTSESPYGRQQDAGYGSYRSTPHGARTIRPYRHKCCVCGRTDVSDPDLEFRYCSKCIGPYEYCSEHIYTHVHKSPSGSGNG